MTIRHPALLRALRGLAIVATTMVLTACPTVGLRPPPPTVDRAESLERQGDHAGAATVFAALAEENAGTDRARLLVRAARAWLEARRPDDAERTAALIDVNAAPELALDRSLIDVEIAIARGQGARAWSTLAAMKEPTDPAQLARFLETRETAAFASGRAADGVRAQLARERLFTDPRDLAASREALLRELRDAAERGVRLDTAAAKEPLVRGWLELGAIAAAMARSPVAATPQLEAWRMRYPAHPASEAARTELLGARPGPVSQAPAGANVALLLPLTGRQAGAATSVREGFFAAWYRAPEATRPEVRVYDTGAVSVQDAVDQATADGAAFIVGPLMRDELVGAASITTRRPPILALNFLPIEQPAPENFYQFALSPEDEARQVARRVIAQGQRRGVALVPAGDWGTRVLAAFNEELLAGGGQVLAQGTLAGRADYSSEITQVLRIADSRARHRRLENVLGTQLQFEPRRRADVQFIFAATPAATARLLRPQLRFHFAGDIPTYATSDAFDPSPAANEDMSGLIFPDMPWMLGEGTLTREVRDEAREAWPTGGPRRGRLFAFGFDAFGVMDALRAGTPTIRVEGLTGLLTLDPERKIRRALSWAQMKGGEPQIIASAVAGDATAPN